MIVQVAQRASCGDWRRSRDLSDPRWRQWEYGGRTQWRPTTTSAVRLLRRDGRVGQHVRPVLSLICCLVQWPKH